jgi:excisionase family DNA binding protein
MYRERTMIRPTQQELDEIMAQELATVEEAAKVLRIGRTHAYSLVRTQQLRTIRIGRRVLVPTDAIRGFKARGTDAA